MGRQRLIAPLPLRSTTAPGTRAQTFASSLQRGCEPSERAASVTSSWSPPMRVHEAAPRLARARAARDGTSSSPSQHRIASACAGWLASSCMKSGTRRGMTMKLWLTTSCGLSGTSLHGLSGPSSVTGVGLPPRFADPESLHARNRALDTISESLCREWTHVNQDSQEDSQSS